MTETLENASRGVSEKTLRVGSGRPDPFDFCDPFGFCVHCWDCRASCSIFEPGPEQQTKTVTRAVVPLET